MWNSSNMSDNMWNSSNMSDNMWNSSNITNSISSSSSDLYSAIEYSCVAFVQVLATIFIVVNCFLLFAIRDCHTVLTGVRVVLCNIVITNQVFIICVLLYAWAEVAEAHDYKMYNMFWRVMYVALCSASAARLLFMATYGIMVYVSTRLTGSSLRTKDVSNRALIVICIVVWLVAIVPNLSQFITLVHEVTINAVSAFCMGGAAVFYLDYSLIILPLYGVVCGFISILFPILTAHYCQKVILGEKKYILKRMTKFSSFLLLSNVVNFAGVYASIVFTSFDLQCTEYYITLNVGRTGAIMLSLGITPVVMLAFFKCIRDKFKDRLICCVVPLVLHQFSDC